jgi:hypothetical protein
MKKRDISDRSCIKARKIAESQKRQKEKLRIKREGGKTRRQK